MPSAPFLDDRSAAVAAGRSGAREMLPVVSAPQDAPRDRDQRDHSKCIFGPRRGESEEMKQKEAECRDLVRGARGRAAAVTVLLGKSGYGGRDSDAVRMEVKLPLLAYGLLAL